jgi:hypothetical protein
LHASGFLPSVDFLLLLSSRCALRPCRRLNISYSPTSEGAQISGAGTQWTSTSHHGSYNNTNQGVSGVSVEKFNTLQVECANLRERMERAEALAASTLDLVATLQKKIDEFAESPAREPATGPIRTNNNEGRTKTPSKRNPNLEVSWYDC